MSTTQSIPQITLMVEKDKCPLDLLANLTEEHRRRNNPLSRNFFNGAIIYFDQAAKEDLLNRAHSSCWRFSLDRRHDPQLTLEWEETPKFPATIVILEGHPGDEWLSVKLISAEDIDFKIRPKNPKIATT